MTNLPVGIDRDNLMSAAMLGLVEAAKQFDPTQDVQFKTFAYLRIRGAVIDELRRNSVVSQNIFRDINQIRSILDIERGPINIEKISKLSGFSVNHVKTCLEAMKFCWPSRLSDSAERQQEIVCPADTPEISSERNDLIRKMRDCLDQIPSRSRQILTLYFFEGLRLKEIGIRIGVSESRVSRLLEMAKSSLRIAMESPSR